MHLKEATWENEQFLKKHSQLQALRENNFKEGAMLRPLC
jgi:hypothetical protein